MFSMHRAGVVHIGAWARRLMIAGFALLVAATHAQADEPGNDRPQGADQVVGGASGAMIARTLEERAIGCPACSGKSPVALLGVFSASGALLDFSEESLYDVEVGLNAVQFRVTGAGDETFDGFIDGPPGGPHGLVGDVEVAITYYDEDFEEVGYITFSFPFTSGHDVFSGPINPPPGTATYDVEASVEEGDPDPGTCNPSDVDFLVISGLTPGGEYEARLLSSDISGVLAWFDGAWGQLNASLTGEEGEPAFLRLTADEAGRIRLGVSADVDEDLDGIVDGGVCPHGAFGAYQIDLRLGRPCPADFNDDGAVTSADFFAFLTAFFDEDADYNHDGATNSADFFAFLTDFFVGCGEPPTLPAAPSNLQVTFAPPGNVHVVWTDNADNETYYRLTVSTEDDSVSGSFLADSTSGDLEMELEARAIVTVEVCAVNDAGSGCAEVMATAPETCTAPSGLGWTYQRPGRVRLSWTDNCDSELEYRIAQSLDGQNWRSLVQVEADETSVSVPNLAPGVHYFFKVRGRTEDGFTEYSNVVQVNVPAAAPAAPDGLFAANVWANVIDLCWNDRSNNESEFRIAISADGVNWDNIGTTVPDDRCFRVEGLAPNTVYFFRVRAANLAGYSGYTSAVQVRTRDTAPAAPTNLRVANLFRFAVDLCWNDNSNNEDEFRIAISIDGVNWDHARSTEPNITCARVDGLAPDTVYFFKVRAANEEGFSDYSNVVQLRTRSAVPAAPSNLRTENVFSRAVDLCWNDNSDNEDEFRIAISRDGTNWDHADSTVPNDACDRIADLAPNTVYFFKVRAANAYGFSEYSNVIQIQTREVVPEAPTSLRTVNIFRFAVDLCWDDNSNNEDEFRIAISRNGQDWDHWGSTVPNDSCERVTGLLANTVYYFKVRAANEAGFSEYTNVIQIRTRP